MRVLVASLVALLLAVAGLAAQVPAAKAAKTLDVYLFDVEGGNATLFVSPSGESVLIDTATAVRPPRETPIG
jgi:hypothetical protein